MQDVKWRYLVVDEAHRLKGAESKLMLTLKAMHFKNKYVVGGVTTVVVAVVVVLVVWRQ